MLTSRAMLKLCYWPISSGGERLRWQSSVMSEGEGGFGFWFFFVYLQLCLDTVSIKFSHFSASNIFLSSSKQGRSAGMSRFLCGQIEMSELALEQNRWRRSRRSGKANELSRCCHTRWWTGWRVSTSLHLFSPRQNQLPAPSWTRY